jgi:hypothetical protein
LESMDTGLCSWPGIQNQSELKNATLGKWRQKR